MSEIILGVMDIAWITSDHDWEFGMNTIFIGLTAVMVISYALFARGFVALSTVFENSLLTVVSYMLIIAMAGLGILDVTSLSVEEIESLRLPYAAAGGAPWHSQYCIWGIPHSAAGRHGRTLAHRRNIGNYEWLHVDNRGAIFHQPREHDTCCKSRYWCSIVGMNTSPGLSLYRVSV